MILGLLIYIGLSIALYFICRAYYLHTDKKIFIISNKYLFYILQFTWGIVMNIIGGLVAIALYATGARPQKFGRIWYFALPIDFGLSLGCVILCPRIITRSLKEHEYGHSIQNALLGPFMVTTVCIPSAVRYWWRKFNKNKNLTAYDAIWFEGQASLSGK